MDDVSRELFQSLFHQNIRPDSLLQSPPRVRIHASLQEKLALLQLLNRTGRLGFRRPIEVQPGFGNGLFCVPKSLQVDRLILDGRPANMLQEPPNRFILSMAASSALLGIHLAPHEKLLMSGEDLSNFFSNFFLNFKVGYDRGTRIVFDWKIDCRLVEHFDGFPDALRDEKYVYATLCTLAMGDSSACEYAQTAHIALGLQSGAIDPSQLLSIHGRVPRSDVMTGIIIDDFIILQRVPKSEVRGIDMEQRRAAMHNMCKKVKLDANPTKGFENLSGASFWGADVDGERGLVRGNVVRAASLC